jgi:hypothetical protein
MLIPRVRKPFGIEIHCSTTALRDLLQSAAAGGAISTDFRGLQGGVLAPMRLRHEIEIQESFSRTSFPQNKNLQHAPNQ